MSATRCNAGPDASEAAWLYGGPHITAAAAEEVRLVSVWIKSVAEQWSLQKAAVRSHLLALDANTEDGETPAFCTALGKQTPTERVAYEILAYMQDSASFNSAIPKKLGAAMTHAEGVWVAELDRGRALGRQLLSRALAVLSEAKLGTLRLCLSALAQLLDLLEWWTLSACASFQQREAWMRSFISVYGSGQRSVLFFRVPEVIEARVRFPGALQGRRSYLSAELCVRWSELVGSSLRGA